MRKPNFFIVGAPKCGTTALYEYLRVHPQIYMHPYEKEPHYFGTDFQGRRFERIRESETTYLSIFKDAEPHHLRIGEASVFYLFSKKAAQEIHDFDPDAKIIIMLREPVDMLYSFYFTQTYSGDEDITTFEGALAAEPDRKAGKRIPRTLYRMVETYFYREMIRYAEQVQRYFDAFGRENVKVIIYDDFKQDTATVYRETLAFLGVDDTFTTNFVIHNANREAKNKWLMQLVRNKALVKLGAKMTQISLPIYKTIVRMNTRTAKRPPLNPETRRQLKAEFAPEVEKLGALLGRDLSFWSVEK